jgi:hypothetical protein
VVGITGSQGIREARLHKGSYGVKFLPGSQERLFNLGKFCREFIDKGLDAGYIVDQANGHAKVSVVVFSV